MVCWTAKPGVAGHRVFFGRVVELADTRHSKRRARLGVGVQVSPWLLIEIPQPQHKAAVVPRWVRLPPALLEPETTRVG